MTDLDDTRVHVHPVDDTLARLVDTLPGLAYRCLNDERWTMLFVSDGCAALTGYPATDLVENRRIAFGDLILPADREDVWRGVQEALDRGEPFQVIYRLRTASGTEKWVWEQGRRADDAPDGTPIVHGLVLDITERKRLEERMAASERTFRTLYESANDAIFLMRGDRFVDCNAKTEEIFACAREQILGRSPIDFSPEYQDGGVTSREIGERRIAAALDGTRQFFAWKHLKADGTPFDAEVSLSRIDLDEGPALLAIVRDVTERRQAYELLEQRVEERTAELGESESRYRGLFERSRDGIFIGAAGIVLDANPAALTLVGGTRDEVIGRPVETFLKPGERERISEALQVSGGSNELEITVRRLDGTLLTCLQTTTRFENEDGVVAFESIIRDITEWKETEEELFAQTRESAILDERNRMAREIHDTLAQGLTGIVLQLEAAEQAGVSAPDRMAGHIERAKALARESLQEARRSVWNLAPQALQEGDLVSALSAEVQRFSSRGLSRAFLALSGERRTLPSDVELSLLRVCQEALLNARKYADASQVRVELLCTDDGVTLIIEDDGRGFDLAATANDGATRGGFGLTSMQQRARQHGGQLLIETAPGRGTRVVATLPLQDERQGAGR